MERDWKKERKEKHERKNERKKDRKKDWKQLLSMKVKLRALLGNYEWPTNKPTNRPTDRRTDWVKEQFPTITIAQNKIWYILMSKDKDSNRAKKRIRVAKRIISSKTLYYT